jgi:peptidoglycan/xylan/chitin deacetylase (PgdA/CDA1 family)
MKHTAVRLPGPFNLARHIRRNGPQVIFPFYHAASDRELPHVKHLYQLPTVKQFRRDLDFLLKYFQPVKMSEYLEGRQLTDPARPPMVLSFDDGLIQCYDEVMPVLLEKGVPATFFLNNAFIDNKAMFFRFKVSLLVEQLSGIPQGKRVKAAEILHCDVRQLRSRLMAVSYVEREITDQVAALWDLSFVEYMRHDPVYLTSIHIRKMLEEGFEFGSHGIDHPMFSLLKRQHTIDHITASVEGLRKQYGLKYSYFAFPFTDSGVEDRTIDYLFRNGIIDAGFGTAGLKDDQWPRYFQRMPMEFGGYSGRQALKGELTRRYFRKLLHRNRVDRAGDARYDSVE